MLPYFADPETVFSNNFASSTHAFWLDTALQTPFSRFSYMGDASGPNSEVVSYSVSSRELTIRRGRSIVVRNESVFSYLDRELGRRFSATPGLPFDFNLGYVGYLGYELKRDL